jgi:hypothetical protein
MKIIPVIVLVLGTAAVQAAAPGTQAEACDQIRARIQAQTGLLARPDTALLEMVGLRPECRFSAAEAYRAAYGDRPMPVDQRRERRRRRHDDDDD